MKVYSRFYAEDHNSGRVSYFLSRKSYLLITDLVRKLMRIHDPRVAALKHDYVEGLKPGKTEIQVSFFSYSFIIYIHSFQLFIHLLFQFDYLE